MTEIITEFSPIFVDKEAGETSGATRIKYSKELDQELWERTNGGTWSLINVHVRTGRGDEAESSGKYRIVLRPGETYEVSVYKGDHGPLSTDPVLEATLKVFCLWKKSEDRNLISDQNRSSGGTWHWHQVATTVPTRIVAIGASRTAPTVDGNGIPVLQVPDGAPTTPLVTTNNHLVEISPLFPGNHYFFVVVVADAFGNWDFWVEEFTTLRRKITVEFKTLHIFNDGDSGSYGEAGFTFRVFRQPEFELMDEFHRSTQDIDDWGETDRPYSLGFAHVGSLEAVDPSKADVEVASWGIEDDGWFDSDEYASNFGVRLPIPAGQNVETVTNRFFMMDCPPSSEGDDFHYGVDIRWSVEYAA